jgi:flagellar biosynthesis anti-sigma factor FlgM
MKNPANRDNGARFDADKVAALRSAIAKGTFRVNAARVAGRLIACANARRSRPFH